MVLKLIVYQNEFRELLKHTQPGFKPYTRSIKLESLGWGPGILCFKNCWNDSICSPSETHCATFTGSPTWVCTVTWRSSYEASNLDTLIQAWGHRSVYFKKLASIAGGNRFILWGTARGAILTRQEGFKELGQVLMLPYCCMSLSLNPLIYPSCKTQCPLQNFMTTTPHHSHSSLNP